MVARASALLLVVVLAIPVTALPTPAVPPHSATSMQADLAHPVWTALSGLGYTPAQWAVLLTSDLDGNGRSDFLDLVVAVGPASGASSLPVELLVRAEPAVLQRVAATFPTAVAIDGQDAVFLSVPLADLDLVAAAGPSLLVWEPRAYATASTNPASGTPASLAQISMHQGGAVWSGSPSYTGSGVTIAILDTGADTGHQALDGGKVSAWKDCTSAAATAYDDHGHGTHVASIAAGDDGTDFRGIAYQASVNAVKILDAGGSGSLAWFQCGINWVKQGGAGGTKTADVASMSAGLGVPPLGITTLNGGPTDFFGWDTVAAQLEPKKIPFSVAAGNWISAVEFHGLDETTQVGVNGVNQVSSPGYSRHVITVGAVDDWQAPAAFTALGPGEPVTSPLVNTQFKPDVAAMGVDVWGALKGTTSQYDQWSGTSMATPLVGGAMALLYQKTSGLSAQAYHSAIRNGAVQGCYWSASATTCNMPALADPNFVMGQGVLKAQNSLAYV